uniref:Seminal fluid protein HACP016 n=1 Tax=Rhabditophanes sp. KR3021 TaxID=114890 RepID=A0AC35U9W0_9BILA
MKIILLLLISIFLLCNGAPRKRSIEDTVNDPNKEATVIDTNVYVRKHADIIPDNVRNLPPKIGSHDDVIHSVTHDASRKINEADDTVGEVGIQSFERRKRQLSESDVNEEADDRFHTLDNTKDHHSMKKDIKELASSLARKLRSLGADKNQNEFTRFTRSNDPDLLPRKKDDSEVANCLDHSQHSLHEHRPKYERLE